MKKVISYLIHFQKQYFDVKLYLSIAFLLAVCIFIEYRWDFKHSVIDRYYATYLYGIWIFLLHGLPYLITCFILFAFGKTRSWLSSVKFWVSFLLGMGLISLDRSFYRYDLLLNFLGLDDVFFFRRCFSRASSLIFVVFPMIILYPFLENDRPRIWYGMKWRNFDPKPYLIMLGLSAVFIGVGSFLSELHHYYPRYAVSGASSYLRNHPQLSEWYTMVIYELSYGSNFISVELIFRGFLIFSLTRVMGPYAVYPMVVTYAVLHFGKPLSETLSSIFGGYILGIVSYYSRNIWGGIFIHLGIAWLMELFGWLQR